MKKTAMNLTVFTLIVFCVCSLCSCVEYGSKDQGAHTQINNIQINDEKKDHTHEYSDWSAVKQATCTEAGKKQKICSCGDAKYEFVSAKGHKEGEWLVDNDGIYSNKKIKYLTCSECGIAITVENASRGLAYEPSEDGSYCTITGIGTCTDTQLYIGEVIDGYKVKAIAPTAFTKCKQLTSVRLPDTLESIGKSAFLNLNNISSVDLGDSVSYIGVYAFRGCDGITTIDFPDSLKTIDIEAFLGCANIKSITLPDSVETVRAGAFSGCVSIEEITLPFVGESRECKSTFGYIFDSMKISGCVEAKQNGISYYIPEKLKSVRMTGGQIKNCAFQNCSGIVNLIIPDDITEVGDKAFDGCKGLKLTVYENGKYIGSENNPYLVLKSVASTKATYCKINENTKFICSYAFRNSASLESVTIPDSVIYIGDKAFENCTALVSISTPNSVDTILDYTFAGCKSLKNVSISSSVTYIGEFVFMGCSALETITFPDSVTHIGAYSFQDCTSLKNVVFGDSLYKLSSYLFSGCSALETITVPVSVRWIESRVLFNCKSFKDLYYKGSKKQFLEIYKSSDWNEYSSLFNVHYAVE